MRRCSGPCQSSFFLKDDEKRPALDIIRQHVEDRFRVVWRRWNLAWKKKKKCDLHLYGRIWSIALRWERYPFFYRAKTQACAAYCFSSFFNQKVRVCAMRSDGAVSGDILKPLLASFGFTGTKPSIWRPCLSKWLIGGDYPRRWPVFWSQPLRRAPCGRQIQASTNLYDTVMESPVLAPKISGTN